MKHNLNGVSKTLLIPLWARAVEAKHSNPIIKDDKAVEIAEQIQYDFSRFDKIRELRPELSDNTSTNYIQKHIDTLVINIVQIAVAVKTELSDNAIKSFINKNPDAIIINIGCGLDTSFFRLDNGRIRWYDLDLPEPINIRRQFFNETDRYKMIGKSVFDYSWIDEIIEIVSLF